MATLLTIGCTDCGRQLKAFQPMLVERLSRGHGCHFCGGDLRVPPEVLAEVGLRAKEADASAPLWGTCLGCLGRLTRRSEAATTWSCYRCGAVLRPPATAGGVCRGGPHPGETPAHWRDVTDVVGQLEGLQPWALRIRTMLIQRAHRGEVALSEAQELVAEVAMLARWKPTGRRQRLPMSPTTLADLIPAALFLRRERGTLTHEGRHIRLNIPIPDITEVEPELPLPGREVWGRWVSRAKLKRYVADVAKGAVSGRDRFLWEEDDDDYDAPLVFPATVHITGQKDDSGWALRHGVQIHGYKEGSVRSVSPEIAARFYRQIGRIKGLAERYMKLRALFGPLLRPRVLQLAKDAVESRLDELGLPMAAAHELVVEAQRDVAGFKRLVGL